MRYIVGLNDDILRRGVENPTTEDLMNGQAVPIVNDTDRLVNAHVLVAGMSGMGKSYQIQSYIRNCANAGVEVDAFDPHEELDVGRGAVGVKFSNATRYGYNPLEVHLNEHSGGIENQISSVVSMMNQAFGTMGHRQEAALRHLLEDVYYLRGMYPDQPSSWRKQRITEDLWDRMIQARDYTGLRSFYPTVRDVIQYADRKLVALRTGGNTKTANSLERVNQAASRLRAVQTKARKSVSDEEVRQHAQTLEKEKEKAIEAYIDLVRSIELGTEMRDERKFTNPETLLSLLDRLEMILKKGGIWRANPPPFGDAIVRSYQIKDLPDEDQKLLVYTRAKAIFREAVDAGKQPTLRRVVALDEGQRFMSDDPDNPLNIIATQGRKFGLGLVIGSQSPTHFSEDFLTNCGTVILTGVHERYQAESARSLGLEKSAMQRIRGQEVIAMRTQAIGETSSRYTLVNVNQAVVAHHLNKMRQQRAPA